MTHSFHQANKTPCAWVVFSGKADMRWLKIFKSGFRHCYVLLQEAERWITIDPMSSYMDVTVHNVPAEFNFPLWLQERGHVVVKAATHKPSVPAPWMVFSCVEAVKRILGIQKFFIITPWQLYRHLETIQTKENNPWAV